MIRRPLMHALLGTLALSALLATEALALDPLPQELVQTFESIPADPRPKNITRSTHYWISNEYRHDLFQERISDTGGVYVGVGTDQNYLLAAWSKPEILVLMDFDHMIPRIHDVYRLIFAKAETPEDFIAWWQKDKKEEVVGLIKEAYEGERLKDVLKAFKTAQHVVIRRLKGSKKRYTKRNISIFLTDQAQYDYIRDLYAKNRVFAVRGDLTGPGTLKAIGAAAEKAGLKVRTLYMSNAEQYFDYKQSFKENIGALPFDEKSTALHTLGWSVYGYADGHYHYNWQSGPNFQDWLANSKMKSLGRMLNARTKSKEEGLSFFDLTPQAWKDKIAARRAKRKKKGKKKSAPN
ncbi:MAG: hypothetical protein ACE366_12665 [Bradymonadia bacterium]